MNNAPPKVATLVLSSNNAKIGDVAATYVSIAASCPASCPLRGNGCYAEDANVGMHVRRLDAAAKQTTSIQAARAEASLIDAVKRPFGRPLRLHVSGDCRNETAARIVAAACRGWRSRGGGPVWAYTHAWRDVAAESWRGVSVLASVESEAQAKQAQARGYVPARVVSEHPADGKATVDANGTRWIPCPEQTRGVKCVDCRLCWNAGALYERGAGITFAVHGQRKKRVLEVLR